MNERYIDGLKKAASRAKEITEAKEHDKADLFIEFVDSIKIAAGSAHQLAHAQMNPLWLNVRDKLESIIELGQNLPAFGEQENTLWLTIRTALLGMAESGRELFTKRAMNRTEVTAELDRRLKNGQLSLN